MAAKIEAGTSDDILFRHAVAEALVEIAHMVNARECTYDTESNLVSVGAPRVNINYGGETQLREYMSPLVADDWVVEVKIYPLVRVM